MTAEQRKFELVPEEPDHNPDLERVFSRHPAGQLPVGKRYETIQETLERIGEPILPKLVETNTDDRPGSTPGDETPSTDH
ncbi:MAG TPA: hypothetical protein VG604_00050 [Candidatus Saccharimonadales bacterium]|nr:hypothetical protein [Candidatus Saccharimonadales bacterium]